MDRNIPDGAVSIAWLIVAPHAGAWIETRYWDHRLWGQLVAPHAGAWIETIRLLRLRYRRAGRSPRGSVDRNEEIEAERDSKVVAPHAGAWIETL